MDENTAACSSIFSFMDIKRNSSANMWPFIFLTVCLFLILHCIKSKHARLCVWKKYFHFRAENWPSKIDLRWWQVFWKSFLGETQIQKKANQFKPLMFSKIWNNRTKTGCGTFIKILFKNPSVYQSQSLVEVLWLILSHQWNSKARSFLSNGPHYLANRGAKKTCYLHLCL